MLVTYPVGTDIYTAAKMSFGSRGENENENALRSDDGKQRIVEAGYTNDVYSAPWAGGGGQTRGMFHYRVVGVRK